jgi:hypothetical protein
VPSPSLLRTSAVLAAIVAATGADAGAIAASSGSAKRIFDTRRGVGIEAPPGWTLSQHTGYPNIIAVLVHPDGSRISIAAAPTAAKDAPALAEENRAGMAAQKLAVTRVAPGPRGGVLVEARATERPEIVRQLYIVRAAAAGAEKANARQAIVVTLVAQSDHLGSAGPAFDWVLARLELETPPATAASPDGGGAAGGGSAGERAGDQHSR